MKLKKTESASIPPRFKRGMEGPERLERPSWLLTSPSQKREAKEEAAAMSGQGRAPELWIKEDEEKIIRIRHAEALAHIWRYSVRVGRKFQSFTRPPEGEVDLFRDQLGLQASLRGVYEVIDIEGYKDKSNKRHRNVVRFWVVNNAVNQQLETIFRKRGPLNRYDITVKRIGSGPRTTYMIMAETPEPMTPEQQKLPYLAKDIERFFEPPSESKQRIICAQAANSAPAEDESD